MSERTTVRLPRELLLQAKRRAAFEGRTLTSLIEEGLRIVTSRERRHDRPKRILPPVRSATGGLMPSIDIVKLADVDETDDLHRLAPMPHRG
jgi:hypothetical protein